jgi:hypothetical protein
VPSVTPPTDDTEDTQSQADGAAVEADSNWQWKPFLGWHPKSWSNP